jgi:hypothetical protein
VRVARFCRGWSLCRDCAIVFAKVPAWKRRQGNKTYGAKPPIAHSYRLGDDLGR